MQLDEDTQSWLTQRNMSWSIRITRQAFCRTEWLTFFLKIWFQEHTHTHTHTQTKSLRYFTKWRGGQFRHTRQACLPCSSYTFLTIILTNIFVSTKIQTLSYKCCRPFRSANYNTQHIHRTTNMVATNPYIYKTVYTRQISKSSDFWLYVRSDTLYRKTHITNAFLQSIRFFCLAMLKTQFLRDLHVCRNN